MDKRRFIFIGGYDMPASGPVSYEVEHKATCTGEVDSYILGFGFGLAGGLRNGFLITG